MSNAEYMHKLVDLARAAFAMDGVEVGGFYEVPTSQFERVNKALLSLPLITLRGLRREVIEGQPAFELLLSDPDAPDPFDGANSPAALRQRAEKAENREQQLRVEIKTLRDEKAALEARVAELLGLLRGIAPQKLTAAVAGYFEAQDAVIHIGADASVFEAARIELEATLRQLQLPLARIDAALEEGGK